MFKNISFKHFVDNPNILEETKKIRKKNNRKNTRRRYTRKSAPFYGWGGFWGGYYGSGAEAIIGGDAGGESLQISGNRLTEMRNGVLPSTFTPGILASVQLGKHRFPYSSEEQEVIDKLEDVDFDELEYNDNECVDSGLDDEQDPDEQFLALRDLLNQDNLNVSDTVDYPETEQDVKAEGNIDNSPKSRILAIVDLLRQELANAFFDEPKQTQTAVEVDAIEQEESTSDFQQARAMFSGMVNGGMSRKDIITAFQKRIGVTNSTAVSYYQRLAKEAGLTSSGRRSLKQRSSTPTGLGVTQRIRSGGRSKFGSAARPMVPEMQPELYVNPEDVNLAQKIDKEMEGVLIPGDPDRQGLIRTVKGAHLVYKRQNEEGKFDELWVFNVGGTLDDALTIRRAILAGTDIPPRATKSKDGLQTYTLTTLGNAQLLHIKGLPN